MQKLIRLDLICNQNCLFCNVRNHHYFEDNAIRKLTTLQVKKKIAGMPNPDRLELAFSGGEPTLRTDLIDLILFSKKRGIKEMTLQTNAIRCSYTDYTKKLKKAGLDVAFVALHSNKEKISDALTRTSGSFKKTIKGIRNLIANGIKVQLNIVINSINYASLPQFVQFVHTNFPKIKYLVFSFVNPAGMALENPFIVPRFSEVESYLNEALRLCKKYGIKFTNPFCGVPLCFISGFEKYSDEYKLKNLSDKERRNIIEEYKLTKVKSDKCKLCIMDKYCLGVWETYAKIHGLDELRPIRKGKSRINKIKK